LQKNWTIGQINYKDVETLELPTDYTRPAIQGTLGAKVSLSIDKNLSGKLQDFSQSQGTTLYMTLLAAFKCCCIGTVASRIFVWALQ
jgi:hypothetical protein